MSRWAVTLPSRGRDLVEAMVRGWSRFFFEADAVAPLRVFRIALGFLLLFAYSIRAIDHEFFYGPDGVLDLARMLEHFPMKYRWSLFYSFPSNAALWIATGIHLLGLATLTLGFFPRISAAVVYLLHVSFMHRNMSVVYGLDMISAFFLFYLIFAKTEGKRLETERAETDRWSTILTSLSLRLIQIQICVIYAYSGWEKLKGMAWWKGEAIWTVIANAQIARWHLDWMSNFPLLISLATYMTLLWEIYFPMAIWIRKLRPWVLLGGLALHLGIALTVFIPFFGFLMIISYASFLTPNEASWILKQFQRLNPFRARRV